MPADRRIRDVLDDAIALLQSGMVFEQQHRRRRIDAQHRRLKQVCSGRDRDRILGADAAGLRPVLALQIDDEIAGFEVADAGSDRADPADALRAGGRGKVGREPVAAAAERQIGRVDRKRQHIEDDLARPGIAKIGRLDTMRDIFRRAVGGDFDLFHRLPPWLPARF